ncbi:MAG: hypothetical protein HYW93_05820, partial [Thaumarchaeota archaeon]|nr:hypothetical protein [Nitrososphaerota archaeon]
MSYREGGKSDSSHPGRQPEVQAGHRSGGVQYTVRAFVEGNKRELDGVCRTFCSMERAVYNLLREGEGAAAIKGILRERYCVWNARWIQSAMNQASAVMESQEEGDPVQHRDVQRKGQEYEGEGEAPLRPSKVRGCQAKVEKYESKMEGLHQQLRERSYPRAVFGSRRLL